MIKPASENCYFRASQLRQGNREFRRSQPATSDSTLWVFLLASSLVSAPYSLAENCCLFIDKSLGVKFRTEEDDALE